MNELNILKRYRRDGGLTLRKLSEYIPAMIMTNLSVLLLMSVDGLVVGNCCGSDALSSVNIFYPVSLMTGTLSVLAASGIATSISTAMGMNDPDKIDRIRGVSLRIMIILAAAVGVLQIPVVWLMIRSYGLSDEMYVLTWQYAIGLMICAPLSLISNVGTYQLQISGRMRVLMWLSVMEGISNLAFDLVFVNALHMGVAGAGAGTACANLLRCSATVFYLNRYTDMYRSSGYRLKAADVKEVLGCGGPDTTYSLVVAFQRYFFMQIILNAFGPDGGAIKGVCSFCFSIANVLISGVVEGTRPVVGLLSGADDKKGLSIVMKQGLVLNAMTALMATLVVWIFPGTFFALHGIREIPDAGIMSLRLFSLYFVFRGFDYMMRMYLSNRKDSGYAVALTMVGNGTLPVFAFIISRMAAPPLIFLSYLLTELLVFALSMRRYRWWLAKDRKEQLDNEEEVVLYMTIRPEDAVEASRSLRAFADENGMDKRVAYRIALCMEEMVAYAKEVNKSIFPIKNKPVNVEVMVKFIGKHDAIFTVLDDGECIALNKYEEQQKLITSNYGIIKKVAKSVDYQYILNLNYTKITI